MCSSDLIQTSAWEVPAIFRWLEKSGGVPRDDMWRTFNMGIGLIVVAGSEHVDALVSQFAAQGGDDVRVIGAITAGASPSVRYA